MKLPTKIRYKLFTLQRSRAKSGITARKIFFWNNLTGYKKLAFYVGTVSVVMLFGLWSYEMMRNAGEIDAAWFNDNWSYRKTLTFTHNAAVTNTKVKFDIDTTAAPESFQADCGDVRFTDANGNLLDYYYDSSGGACDTSSTDFYVLIPNIINGSNLFYMYYGNPSAANGTVATQFSQSTTTPSGGAATLGSEEKAPSPVAHWKFDDGYGNVASDSASLRLHAGLFNSPTWQTEDQCVSGKCLRFDGSDDYVEKSNTLSLEVGTSDWTVETWINSFDLPAATFRTIISNQTTDDGKGITLATFGTALHARIGNGSANLVVSGTGTPLTTNTWYHVAAVYDRDDKVTIYVNGKIVNTTTISSYSATDLANGNPTRIGSRADGARRFTGKMDNMKIYSYARSAAQIKADFVSRGSNEGSSVLGASDQKYLSDGLVGYWKMDESSWNGTSGEVIDASGNGNNGTGGGSVTTATAKYANGGNFDGSDDRVSIADNTSLQLTNNFTIGTWVKSGGTSQNQTYLLNKGNFYAIIYEYVNDTVEFFVGAGKFTGTDPRSSSAITLTDTSWHHIVYTYNGTTFAGYKDGVQIFSTNITFSINSSAGNISYLGAASTSANFFNGMIDETRIYSRAFSATEVSQLYNFAPGPIGEWRFEEGQGTIISDKSTSGNNLNANTPAGWASGKIGKAWNTAGTNYACAWICNTGSGDNSSNSLDFTANENFSISLWFKSNSATNIPSGQKWLLAKGTSGTAGYDIRVNASGRLLFEIDGGDGSYDDAAFGNTDFYDAQWHHITAIKTGTSKIEIFVDGILQGSDTSLAETGDLTNARAFIVGDRVGNGSNVVDGVIDHVRVYRYARTQKQISEDMNAGHPAGSSSMGAAVAHYKFDEGYGSFARSSISGGLIGSISGSTWSSNGKISKSLDFDGADDVVTVTNEPAIDLDTNLASGSSFAMWIYADSDGESDTGQIFQKGTNRWLRVDSQDGSNNIDVEASWDLETTDATVNIADAMTISSWNHIVLTHEDDADDEINVYINGIQKGVSTNGVGRPTSSSLSDTSNLLIGGSTNFDGKIDEFKVYNYSLSSDEVRREYNRGSSLVLGSSGTSSTGVNDNSADRMYCPPGDSTGTCAPIAEWNFEEGSGASLNDTSGNANTATITAGGTFTQGKIGKGLRLDGTANDVSAASSNSLNIGTSDFTLQAWVKGETIEAGDCIFCKTDGGGASTSYGYHFSAFGGSLYPTLHFATTATAHTQVQGQQTLLNNRWYLVSIVVDRDSDTNTKVYVDGKPVTTTVSNLATNTGSITNSVDLAIGSESDGGFNWDGDLDQLRIYNYARSASQIAWDYNRGAPTAHWKFDECQGGTANDSSGNGHTGTITIGGSGTQTAVGTCQTSSTAWGNGATGKKNYSLNFDGTDDYVSISDTDSLDISTESFSASVWVKNTLSSTRTVLSKENGNPYYMMLINGTTGKFNPRVRDSSGNEQSATSTKSVNDGQWHHLVFTWNGTSDVLTAYVDGKLEATDTSPAVGDASNTASFLIGARQGPTNYFIGQIDDVKVFNYPLTAQQVKSLHNDGAIMFGPNTGTP